MARKKSGSGKKKGQSKTATIKVVPTQGSSTESSFTVTKGATVGDALKASGVSAERKNLSIGGKSVTASDPIKAGDTLQVEERPQGS